MKPLAFIVLLSFLSSCSAAPVHYTNAAVGSVGIPGSISVLAAATEWRDSGTLVRRGENYTVESSGQWSAAPTCVKTGATGAGMYGLFCPAWPIGRVIQGHPHQELIGKIGENGRSFAIGSKHSFTADRDGTLYLRMNEKFAGVWDNNGAISVLVSPAGGYPHGSTMASRRGGPDAVLSQFPQWNRAHLNRTSGIYMLERAKTFNVLDKVVFNPENGHITLLGHTDGRYPRLEIPYLQHLATLLETESPAFSLNWTPQSQARIDDLFRRMDSDAEVKRMVARWGEWVDANQKVTPMGRFFMPLFGVTPTNDRFEIIASILRASGNYKGAEIVVKTGVVTRLMNQPGMNNAVIDLINTAVPAETMRNIQAMTHLTNDQRGFRIMQTMCSNLDQIYGLSNQPVRSAFDQAIRQRLDSGTAMTRALAELDRQFRTVLGNAMRDLLHRHDRIRVPPEVIQYTLGIRPEVIPEFIGMDPRSQLARVMYQADYVGKQIPNRMDLEEKIPGFLTEFAYEQRNPGRADRFQSTSTHRLWISVDNVDFVQSPDGYTLKTRDVRMRFNMREMRDGRDLSPRSGSYEALLTSVYDDLAHEFPVLHELRETAKLKAVANWLKRIRPDFSLPVSGRTMWQGPSKVPGLVYFVWSTRPLPGRAVASMIAMGGVCLTRDCRNLRSDIAFPVDTSVVDLRPHHVVAPPRDGLGTLGDILNLPDETPMPMPAGWVTHDQSGITAITLRADSIDRTGPTETRLGKDLEDQALILWKAKDLEGAEAAYLRLENRFQGDPEMVAKMKLLRARVLHEKGDEAAAVVLLNDGALLDPDNPLLTMMLAESLEKSGDRQGAIAALRKVLAMHPDNNATAKLLAELEGTARPGATGPETRPGRPQPFPKGAGNVSSLGVGTQKSVEDPRVIQEGLDIVKGHNIGNMEKLQPVPEFVPESIARHPNFQKAFATPEFKQMIDARGELAKKQEDIQKKLEGAIRTQSDQKDQKEGHKERLARIQKLLEEQTMVDEDIKKVDIQVQDILVSFKEEGEKAGAEMPKAAPKASFPR